MLQLAKLLFLCAVLLCLCPPGHGNPEAAMLFKDLSRMEGQPENAITEEDYVQIPSLLWADYEVIGGAEKKSGKFKNYMLNKDNEGAVPLTNEGQEPVIRSYIPRTSSKRIPGAILNWAFTPHQKSGFHSGFYRSQAHLRPAALE